MTDFARQQLRDKGRASGSHEALALIKGDVTRLRRRRSERGVVQWLRRGAHAVLFKVPAALYGPFAEGLGKAFGERAAG